MGWFDILKAVRPMDPDSVREAEKQRMDRTRQQDLYSNILPEGHEPNLPKEPEPEEEEENIFGQQLYAGQKTLTDKEPKNPTERVLDDEGVAESDVYNTNEALTTMRNRLMRPIQGNNASKVARLLELTSLAAIDETSRPELIREIDNLTDKMR